MLINVTSFFRDRDVFEVLKQKVFPAMVQGRRLDAPIRVWVAGYATGEETYSIAIALLEYLEHHQLQYLRLDLRTALHQATKTWHSEISNYISLSIDVRLNKRMSN